MGCFESKDKNSIQEQKIKPERTSQQDNASSPQGPQHDREDSGKQVERNSNTMEAGATSNKETDSPLAEQADTKEKGERKSKPDIQMAAKSEGESTAGPVNVGDIHIDIQGTKEKEIEQDQVQRDSGKQDARNSKTMEAGATSNKETDSPLAQQADTKKKRDERKSKPDIQMAAKSKGESTAGHVKRKEKEIEQDQVQRNSEENMADLPDGNKLSRTSDGGGVTEPTTKADLKNGKTKLNKTGHEHLNGQTSENKQLVESNSRRNLSELEIGSEQNSALRSDRTAEACKQTSEQTSGNKAQANDARNNQGKTKLTETDEDTVRKSGEIVLCEPDAETQDKDRQSEGQEKESTKGQEIDKEKKYDTRRIQEECRPKEDNTANGLKDVKKTETQGKTTEPIRPNRKLETENKELKIKVQEKEEKLAKLKTDLEEKENTIKELEDEIKETQDRASKTMNNESERKTTKYIEELAKLKQQLMEVTTEKENIKSKMEDMKKEKDVAVAKKVKEIMNLEKEKDELLCRLSEMAGRRLTDNNPNIADLSDLNRPTKLAEKYAELYDNDWTDAYSYLENLDAYKGSEVTVIASLLTMLTTAYKLSLETAESQLEALHHILSDFSGSIQHQDQQVKDVIKQLKDQRKRAVQPSKDLTVKYRKEIEKAFPKLDSSIFESELLKPYLQKCLELCWLMAIQDPPVHLKCDGCKNGELFNKNMYKEYTKAGPLIIYTVWPAVFLEKDGALLCKGVVQCDKRLSTSVHVAQGTTVIQVSKKSASLRASGTQPLTTFPAKDDISDKVDRATIMETKRDHSEKQNSQTAADNTGGRVHESEILIATF